MTRRLNGNITRVQIPPGSHRLQARSADGNSASFPLVVEDGTQSADVALFPLRAIAGRIVQTDADPAGRSISLEHMQVKLEPGGVLAESEPDGTFAFPATPVTPYARLHIVADSLPDGLTLGDDAPVDATPLILTVTTKINIHRKSF